jgi:uncharacterized protein
MSRSRLSSMNHLLPALLLSALSPAALGCDEKAAYQALEAGDYENGPQLLSRCALQGDAEAQTALAQLYQSGNGVGVNAVEAAWWYAKAAEQGQAEAQFQLGIMYLEGIGVTQNSSSALHWISQAAKKHHQEAREVLQYILFADQVLDC